MKESEIYKKAQIEVINSICLDAESKLEILKVLMSDERLALFSEEQKKKVDAV